MCTYIYIYKDIERIIPDQERKVQDGQDVQHVSCDAPYTVEASKVSVKQEKSAPWSIVGPSKERKAAFP